MIDVRKIYKYNVENYRRINHSLNVLESQIRHAIASDDRDTHKALLPLYMLLLGASAEARLLKVLMEPNKFSQVEITQIQKARTHKDRWLELIKVSFLKRSGRPIDSGITEHLIGRSAWNYYTDLVELVNDELELMIGIRNKLAHGQFEYPFVSWEDPYQLDKIKISEEHKRIYHTENLLTMIIKRHILDNVLNIIRDLGVSKKAFPRDFDKYYRKISMLRIQVRTKSYEKYKSSLVKKYQNSPRGAIQEEVNSCSLFVKSITECIKNFIQSISGLFSRA